MRKYADKITVKRLSCITLIIMGFGGLLLAVSEICGGFLPDIAVRIIGIADIICLTLFVFLFVLGHLYKPHVSDNGQCAPSSSVNKRNF